MMECVPVTEAPHWQRHPIESGAFTEGLCENPAVLLLLWVNNQTISSWDQDFCFESVFVLRSIVSQLKETAGHPPSVTN